MPTVPAYHSLYGTRYHYRDTCAAGVTITDPLPGKGGLPPCDLCAEFAEAEARLGPILRSP